MVRRYRVPDRWTGVLSWVVDVLKGFFVDRYWGEWMWRGGRLMAVKKRGSNAFDRFENFL